MSWTGKDARRAATFSTPAKGLVVRTAEGPRLGRSFRTIPTPERRAAAIASLIALTRVIPPGVSLTRNENP